MIDEVVREIVRDEVDRIVREARDSSEAEALETVAQVVARCPAFTRSTLYKLIARRNQNGLWRATVKIGGRILIHRDLFDQWIRERIPEGGRP